jgi:plasmid maintenance system antidote protein VapI
MRPIHPGEILKDELDELELSASAFAKQLSVPVNRVTSIILETAVRDDKVMQDFELESLRMGVDIPEW